MCHGMLEGVGGVKSSLTELNALWSWCYDNGRSGMDCCLRHRCCLGVPLVGTEACKISLCESESGDRGIYAVSEIQKDEIILTIPLRLALADYKDDEASNAVIYEVCRP